MVSKLHIIEPIIPQMKQKQIQRFIYSLKLVKNTKYFQHIFVGITKYQQNSNYFNHKKIQIKRLQNAALSKLNCIKKIIKQKIRFQGLFDFFWHKYNKVQLNLHLIEISKIIKKINNDENFIGLSQIQFQTNSANQQNNQQARCLQIIVKLAQQKIQKTQLSIQKLIKKYKKKQPSQFIKSFRYIKKIKQQQISLQCNTTLYYNINISFQSNILINFINQNLATLINLLQIYLLPIQQIPTMQTLLNYNIVTRSLTKDNLEAVLETIRQAYADHPIIVDKIQTMEQLSNNTKDLMIKVLNAEQEINRQLNTNRTYSGVYYLNDKIVAITMMCDLNMFLKIVRDSQHDILFQPLNHLTEMDKKQYNVYSGKSIITKQLQSKGLAKYFLIERMEHLYQYGYQNVIAITSNIPSNRVWKRLGAEEINDSIYTQANGNKLKLVLIRNSILNYIARTHQAVYAKL